MSKRKRTNNNAQNTTQKTKDRPKPTPLKTGVNYGTPEWKVVPVPHVTIGDPQCANSL